METVWEWLLGFLPFSTVGYSLSNTSELTKRRRRNRYQQELLSYAGDGGLQQVFAGVGFKVLDNLSIGANISYIYGDITHSVTTAFQQLKFI